MMADKSIDDYLKHIAPLCKKIVTVTVSNNQRAQSAQKLKAAAEKYCPDVTACDDVCKAIQLVKEKMTDDACLLVCGSLYLAGEARGPLINFFTG